MINVIAMLTNHDVTVPNAKEVFEANKNSKVGCWGFKDVGIDTVRGTELVAAMKAAGKTTFLEPLVEEDSACVKAAKFAIECKFDYLISMIYNKEAAAMLKANGIKFFPTCGKRAGMPRMLYGTHESIILDAERILDSGVDGICLSVYRYADGDPEVLAKDFLERDFDKPFMIAGGINSSKRLDMVKNLGPWGFTIGSALFDDSFGKFNSVADKLDYLKAYLE